MSKAHFRLDLLALVTTYYLQLTTYYSQLTTYYVYPMPKAHFRLDLTAPAAYQSPGAAVLAHLFAQLVSDELNEYSYHAQVQGTDGARAGGWGGGARAGAMGSGLGR